MLRLLKNKRAQNTIEYALIIAVVIGAFSAMQLYNRRAINMRVKQGMDRLPLAVISQEDMGKAGTTPLISGKEDPRGAGQSILGTDQDRQYEPYYYAKGTYDMTVISTEGKDVATFGEAAGSKILTGQSSRREGAQEVTGVDRELQ